MPAFACAEADRLDGIALRATQRVGEFELCPAEFVQRRREGGGRKRHRGPFPRLARPRRPIEILHGLHTVPPAIHHQAKTRLTCINSAMLQRVISHRLSRPPCAALYLSSISTKA